MHMHAFAHTSLGALQPTCSTSAMYTHLCICIPQLTPVHMHTFAADE